MAVALTGIPEKVTRAARDEMARSLGFDVDDLVEVILGINSITATVFARNAEGLLFADGDGPAVHIITIPVEDS